MQKIKKAAEDPKITDIFEYLVSKSKNLPMKFNPPEKSEIYSLWKTTISQLLEMKSSYFDIHKQIEEIRSFYSGRKQKMSYFTFIEQLTENEEETSFFIRDSLLEIREKLKKSNDFLHAHNEKEIKLLNLDLEREVIEFEEDDLELTKCPNCETELRALVSGSIYECPKCKTIVQERKKEEKPAELSVTSGAWFMRNTKLNEKYEICDEGVIAHQDPKMMIAALICHSPDFPNSKYVRLSWFKELARIHWGMIKIREKGVLRNTISAFRKHR